MTPANQKRLTWLAWLLAACVLVFAVSRGFSGPTRRLDARAVLLGGICWSKGVSPYLTEAYSAAWQMVFQVERPADFIFAYPPTIGLVLVPLAWFGLGGGLAAIDILNLAALGLVLWGCLKVASLAAEPGPWSSLKLALSLFCASLVGPISGTLLLGQTGFWSLGAMVGLWALPKDRLGALRIACVIIATTKPSLALPVLCFVAVTEPMLMVKAGVLALLLCAPIVFASGGPVVIGQWLSAIKAYAAMPANSPLELSSAQHLVFRFAPVVPHAALTGLSALFGLFLGAMARKQKAPISLEHWLLLIAMSAALLPLHTYDLILVIPLAAAIPYTRGSSRFWYPLGVLLAARPQALDKILGKLVGVLEHGTPMIAAVGTTVLALGALAHYATGRSVLSDHPATQAVP